MSGYRVWECFATDKHAKSSKAALKIQLKGSRAATTTATRAARHASINGIINHKPNTHTHIQHIYLWAVRFISMCMCVWVCDIHSWFTRVSRGKTFTKQVIARLTTFHTPHPPTHTLTPFPSATPSPHSARLAAPRTANKLIRRHFRGSLWTLRPQRGPNVCVWRAMIGVRGRGRQQKKRGCQIWLA